MAIDLSIVSVFGEGGTPPDSDGHERKDQDDDQKNDPATRIRLRHIGDQFRILAAR